MHVGAYARLGGTIGGPFIPLGVLLVGCIHLLEPITHLRDDAVGRLRQLLELVEYKPPQRVVLSGQRNFAQSKFQMVVNNGGSQEEAQSAAEDAFTSCEALVEKSMKRQAIVFRLRALHNLTTSEDQVQEHIRQMAAVQNKRPEQLRQELVDAGELNNISAKVLEKEITLLAMQHCTLLEIDAETLQ